MFDERRDNPLEVRVFGRSKEALDQALARLKRNLEKEGIFQTLRDRMYFRSKSRKAYEARRQAEHKRETKRAGVKVHKRDEEKKHA